MTRYSSHDGSITSHAPCLIMMFTLVSIIWLHHTLSAPLSSQHQSFLPVIRPVHVVTHADHAGHQFCSLLYTAALRGIKMTVLGWKDRERNKLRKLTTMVEFLQTIPEDDLVLFTDGFDTMFVGGDLRELVDKYESFESPIVVAAETNCWPFRYPYGDAPTMRFNIHDRTVIGGDVCNEFPVPPHKSPFRYLNSGNLMGTAAALLPLYQSILREGDLETMEDQREFALRYLNGKFGMVLDTQTTIFHPLEQAFHYLVQQPNGHWFNTATGQYPLIVHFNGDKSRMNHFAETLRQQTVDLRRNLNIRSFFSFRNRGDVSFDVVCPEKRL
eukprot:GILJ01016555.1.p1 GENE.GILJ01016555.1~~GILJ01016555.1.p1  ORF type:complete len:356 (+),score=34.30 GILJ01016555.1:87-1070(+)